MHFFTHTFFLHGLSRPEKFCPKRTNLQTDPRLNLHPVKTGQNRQNEQVMLALTFIWHNKPLASWVMYPVATPNIKHSFRFLSYIILTGNGENKRYY